LKTSAKFFTMIVGKKSTFKGILNLNFQKKAGAIAPVGPKVKPSRGGAVFTDSPKIPSESG